MQTEPILVYNAPARVLHWLTAALLLIQFVIAWTMPDVHRDTKPVGLIAWHLGIGMVILLFVLIRFLWRSTHVVPPDVVTLPPALRAFARLTHRALYLLLIVVPMMGWANASSRGWPVSLFGVMPMPPLSPTGSALGHALGDWHRNLAWVLLALAVMHIGAALFHHFILRDGTLKRMLPPIEKP
ncbi:cytochrome b [Caballeronia ptereochthonis]|uniref:Cytochrome B561 n=1 Tax=Caballeronia ptereochthonis TaxID=1777144 RepID=A0A158DHH5_9BURK|nr:cytochrome b [Caballeronia ptereochthonis]SAK94018.1 cytochrome B561 [Caballeronia ptereochthonis]